MLIVNIFLGFAVSPIPPNNQEKCMNSKLDKKKKALTKNLMSFDNIAVALSGGVDSAVLLAEAHDVLGDRVMAITARSPIYPEQDFADAVNLCNSLGVSHLSIDFKVMENKKFLSNSLRRCYFCKRTLFAQIYDAIKSSGMFILAHGANADDLHDYRPGMQAALECGVNAPLLDAGFTKKEVREIARQRGLSVWNKPAMACLATRIAYDHPITMETIQQIKAAESFLKEAGVEGHRVRHHGTIARLELPVEQFSLLTRDSMRHKIVDQLRRIGFDHVCLDMEGYVSGSMNRALKLDNKEIVTESKSDKGEQCLLGS